MCRYTLTELFVWTAFVAVCAVISARWLYAAHAVIVVCVWVAGTVAVIKLAGCEPALWYSTICGCVFFVATSVLIDTGAVALPQNRLATPMAVLLGLVTGIVCGVSVWLPVAGVSWVIARVQMSRRMLDDESENTTHSESR